MKILEFDKLKLDELYGILKLRNEVFVYEQNCRYIDLDELDKTAIHIFNCENDRINAYLRINKLDRYIKISRVVVRKDMRNFGLGSQLLKAAIKTIDQRYPKVSIYLSAQIEAIPLYKKFGFVEEGDIYLEAGIEHVDMYKRCI